MKILFLGHGRCGKDHACEYVSHHTGLINAGTCSKYLCKYVAQSLGVTELEAYENRHANRVYWFEFANNMRKNDPTILVREMLREGDVGGGIRGKEEILETRRLNLADLIVWIDRDVPVDPTMEYGPEMADIVIQNYWGIDEYEQRLNKLCKLIKGVM